MEVGIRVPNPSPQLPKILKIQHGAYDLPRFGDSPLPPCKKRYYKKEYFEEMQSHYTFLPTSLLCKLKAVLASLPFSSLSIKRLVSLSPNFTLSLHPPHCQSSPGFFCFLITAQPHPGTFPSLHWSVISCVMAAALIAWINAVSRVAIGKWTHKVSCIWTKLKLVRGSNWKSRSRLIYAPTEWLTFKAFLFIQHILCWKLLELKL